MATAEQKTIYYGGLQLSPQNVAELLEKANHKQLQALAKEIGRPANGTNDEIRSKIIAYVMDSSGVKRAGHAISNFFLHGNRPGIEELQGMTVAKLKEQCKVAGVSATGK